MDQQQNQQHSRQQNTEDLVAIESESGHLIWLPVSQAAAYQAGQRKAKRGEPLKDKERRVSAILSMLRGSKP